MIKYLIGFLMAIPLISASQQNEGKIYYAQVFKIDNEDAIKRMEERGGMDQMIEMMKQPQKATKVLLIKPGESYFRSYSEDIDSAKYNTHEVDGNSGATNRGGGMRRMMMAGGMDIKSYRNFDKNLMIEERDLMDKKFLIKDSLENIPWKMTTEFRTIEGYTCQKATFADSNTNVVAWFTPQIQVFAGPEGYGRLPGLILELDINEGRNIYKAKYFEFRELLKDELEEPKKGKVVTRDEFNRIQKEKMEEMRKMYGGGGNNTVIIHR